MSVGVFKHNSLSIFLSTYVSSEVFKHIRVFLGALLHVYLLLYLSTSVSSGVFEHMCLLIYLSKFVLSVFNNTCVSTYVVSDLFKYKCFPMHMNTSVSSDVFKHIYVPSGVFEHVCVFCSVEAPPAFFWRVETHVFWCVEAYVSPEVFKGVFLVCLSLFVSCVVYNNTC